MPSLPRNILEQQAANKRNTFLVMLLFVLFLGFLGFGCDTMMFGYSPGGGHRGSLIGFPLATMVALGYGGMRAWVGFRQGSQTVLQSAGAMPASPNDPRYQQLFNIVDEMSIASGLPRPAVYVIPDPDPNAFATGRDPQRAAIAVTQGLVDTLTREELQAVIAHEMSHVRNYDIRLMTVVAALIGAVMLISEFGLRSFHGSGGRGKSSSSRSGGPFFLIIWLLAMILSPLISRILAMAVSRQREYLADASAGELTRNPLALASALSKIDAADDPTRSIKKGSAHLCIADPLGREANEREGFLADLFGTHPPIQRRILALKAMAYVHS
jgi:heat shock protein HtpX